MHCYFIQIHDTCMSLLDTLRLYLKLDFLLEIRIYTDLGSAGCGLSQLIGKLVHIR